MYNPYKIKGFTMNSRTKNNKLIPQQPRNQQLSQDTLPGNIVYIFTESGCIREAWENFANSELYDVLRNDNGEISNIGEYEIKYVDGGTPDTQRNEGQNHQKFNTI